MRSEAEIIADIERWANNRVMVNKFKEELAEVVANPKPAKSEPKLDLNGDGKIDKKDRSIAGKVLRSGHKKNK